MLLQDLHPITISKIKTSLGDLNVVARFRPKQLILDMRILNGIWFLQNQIQLCQHVDLIKILMGKQLYRIGVF